MENSEAYRFKDKNLVAGNFSGRILVECPKCKKRAEIITDYTSHQSVLNCPNCHYHATTAHKRIDLALNVYCNNCASRINISITDVKEKKQAIKITCSACGETQVYTPSYSEHISWGEKGNGKDPFLGLELWLQESFREQLCWAYNYEHILYLEEYITAKLRERNNRKHMTMVEKLPGFIKSAKNREGLLKLIGKLKTK